MQKASRLLETTPAGVAEIAKRVGYDNQAAFSKAFKRSIWWRRGRIAGRRRWGVSRGFARPARVPEFPPRIAELTTTQYFDARGKIPRSPSPPLEKNGHYQAALPWLSRIVEEHVRFGSAA
jgi:hypothetical protein